MPKPAEPAPKKAADADASGEPHAGVAAPAGPITVEKTVDDEALRGTLVQLLPQYPGVRHVDIRVRSGVVTLEGQAEDDDTCDEITAFARKVEGVRLVLNRMKTDAQVMSGTQLAAKVLRDFGATVSQKWLLVVLAIGIIFASFGLARLFGANSEVLLAPFVSNVLLRAVLGSILSSLLIIGGFMIGLTILNLTHAVLSILGLAGVVGLAVGFAFRDIAENFIASILLGVRRPFRIGDYIQVAGQAGVVLSLNTRATVLVTLEGNHIRIPNAIIYKEILVNSSASSSSRSNFDILIPYEVSTAKAIEAISSALHDQEGILSDPPPKVLVDGLEVNGVRIKAYYWIPVQGVDGMRLQSDTKLRAKVALQQAKITPPPANMSVSILGRVPIDIARAAPSSRLESAVRPSNVVTSAQAEANLRKDTRAAEAAAATLQDGEATPAEHALNQAMAHVSEEGTNLLTNGTVDTPAPAS
ncbi:mechanosensitive ion channel family protein [Singulisphaera sp. PoT]|uniref:mechanosensitive ion channel family protein n=1 Tax=Singulisphaera sp. PoT TaxID=3411797 RepID=UPI003BF53097